MIALSTEQNLALSFCRARLRQIYVQLLQFDRSLGRAVQQGGPPLAGQIRLAWWRDQIAAEQFGRGASPVLAELDRALPDKASAKDKLVRIVDGWELLLGEAGLSDEILLQFASDRGGSLFALAARASRSEAESAAEAAGKLWALVDLARHSSDPALSARAFGLARDYLGSPHTLPHDLLPFSILAYFAERDIVRGSDRLLPSGSPHRILQAWRFSLRLA
jgi:phytoene synthase